MHFALLYMKNRVGGGLGTKRKTSVKLGKSYLATEGRLSNNNSCAINDKGCFRYAYCCGWLLCKGSIRKKLVMLSRFWLEGGTSGWRGGGEGAVNKSVKKGNKNIFFQVMLNEVQNIFEK